MERSFRLQKIMFKGYIVAMVLAALFALGFMTRYSNLFGLELELNAGIKNFHDNVLQKNNNFYFWIGIIGSVSIILMFALEINKKICDLFALIVSSVVSGAMAIVSVVCLTTFPDMIKKFKDVDFKYLGLEDPKYLETPYVKEFTTFYIGYAVYGLILVLMIGFIAINTYNFRKYLKMGNVGE